MRGCLAASVLIVLVSRLSILRCVLHRYEDVLVAGYKPNIYGYFMNCQREESTFNFSSTYFSIDDQIV